MLLPIDQGIEHGPRDFFPNPASKDPDYQFRLAAEAGYSALACQIGMATKYYPDYAGQVPLILKVNGKTDIPSSAHAFSSCNASVEDAVRLGADAVGYTLYVGSPRQDEDLAQLRQVREDCDRFGMPLIVWSYPRGEAVDAKGSANSFYAIDYAARMAMEMGADVVKLNMPKIDPDKDKDAPAPYNEMQVDQAEAIRQCVESAGRSLVVLSGGSKVDDETVLGHTREIMQAGGSGVIFGRNVWQREWNDALEIIAPDQGDAAVLRAPHPVGRLAVGRHSAPDGLGRMRGLWRRGQLGSMVLLLIAALLILRPWEGGGGRGPGRPPTPSSPAWSTATRSRRGSAGGSRTSATSASTRRRRSSPTRRSSASGRRPRPSTTAWSSAGGCVWSSGSSGATSTAGCSPTSTWGDRFVNASAGPSWPRPHADDSAQRPLRAAVATAGAAARHGPAGGSGGLADL